MRSNDAAKPMPFSTKPCAHTSAIKKPPRKRRSNPSLKPTMRYELWHSASEGCHTFFPANQCPADLGADARLIWTVEAATWEEAQTAKHAFLGIEPYRPMESESESESPNPTP